MTPRHVLAVLVALVVLFGATARLRQSAPEPREQPTLELGSLLAVPADGFRRADEVIDFEFPEDHGAHPQFRTEWWYYTGHLESETGRSFGFQLTFFRFALDATEVERASAWGTNQVYMAHLALTDVKAGEFYSYERSSRGAALLAGAQASPFRVWVGDWQARSEEADLFPLRLNATAGAVGLDLVLRSGKPMVLQGERGLSQKAAGVGNASYYYSYTRLPVTGELRVGETSFNVSGSSWLDREWSTSALSQQQQGWDWFAVQLEDGRELMFYRMRRTDDTIDPHSAGIIVDTDAKVSRLGATDVSVRVLSKWRSPVSGIEYPVRWRLDVDDLNLSMTLDAVQPHQEHDLSVRYWEGAATVQATQGARRISGKAYVEMAGRIDSRF